MLRGGRRKIFVIGNFLAKLIIQSHGGKISKEIYCYNYEKDMAKKILCKLQLHLFIQKTFFEYFPQLVQILYLMEETSTFDEK